MSPRNDHELLTAYVERRDEAAFADLVARHADMVYSAAVRQVGRSGLADDVTQAVFILLARKASTIGSAVVVAAWLHKATRYVALNAMKHERRRRTHERRAAEQAAAAAGRLRPRGGEPSLAMLDGNWAQGVALLDEGIARLGRKDREAVVLRFLERRSFAEVGSAIGASEDAAQMRVSRAVEKLRGFFRRNGLIVSAATLRAAVNANAIAPAPTALKSSLASTALRQAWPTSGATGGIAGATARSLADSAGRSMTLATARVASAYAVTGVAATLGVVLLIWQFLIAAPPTSANQPPPDSAGARAPIEQHDLEATANPSAVRPIPWRDGLLAAGWDFLRRDR